MIAVDTNVLIRYLVNDDEQQAEAARVLLSKLTVDNRGFVSREVTLELTWVLKRAYGFSRDKIATVLEQLISSQELEFETEYDILRTVLNFRSNNFEFSDLMVVTAASRYGARPLYTFDRKAARIDGAKLLA